MIPSVFIAHGAPLLAIEDNGYTRFLTDLGKLYHPRAVILFSAHWISGTQKVSNVEHYETIHDFGGFPEELYQIQYPASGDAILAKEVELLLTAEGISYQVDSKRGLDHGAWVVLRLLYPNADVPVISMSVNPRLTPKEQYQIGRSLRSLREKEVLIIASGGTVHNLGALQWGSHQVDPWAQEFDQWLEGRLFTWDLNSLFQYKDIAPHVELAVPLLGNEHFIPLFYAMGAADEVKKATLLHRSYQYGSLSHSVWQFG